MRVPGARLVRRYDRELVCGRCRNVMAFVRLGLFPRPRLRDVAGEEVTPLGGAVALRVAETRLATARADEAAGRARALDEYRGVAASERALAYLRRQAGEVVYELDCPQCAARHVRSLPDLVDEVRQAPAGRVVLD